VVDAESSNFEDLLGEFEMMQKVFMPYLNVAMQLEREKKVEPLQKPVTNAA
jgi:hypothetical protein